MSKMDNSDGNQTNGSEVAANDGFATIEDSSAAMIPPTGDKNLQTADNNSRNWLAQTPGNNASQNILGNNLDATQTTGSEVAANQGYGTTVDSSAALIPQAGDGNLQTGDDGLWNWDDDLTSQENFYLKDLDIPTPHKQPDQLGNNASENILSNNLDATQTTGYVTAVDSSAAMIPPAGDENLETVGDDFWNWVDQTPLESFDLEDLDIPTDPHKQPDQLGNNASQLPQDQEIGHGTSSKLPVAQFIRPNALDTLSPELRSLIRWQSENVASKGKAPVMPDNDIMNINSPVGGGMSNNRKRKGGEVDADNNSENNAWFPRRVAGSRASQPVAYHNYHYQKSTASINDNLMALHELVPGSQKKDMATTLGETADHLLQVRIRDQTLREEIKHLRQAMVMMHQSIQNFRQSPLGTPANMGAHTQLGGMGFRPPVQPSMNLFDSSISARMNMPVLLQWNSSAAASRLFVPPTVPGPSQQHRIGRDQTDDTQPPI